MVAFTLVESAVTWVNDCGFDFPLVVDTERTVYVSLGLPRSVLVWTMQTLRNYAEQMVMDGTEQRNRGKGDDLHQMGGDFIVNSTGKLVFVYHGKTSYDRPSVDDLLAALRTLQEDHSEE